MPYSINHIMLEFSEWIIGHGLNAAILTCAQVHLPFVSKGFFFPIQENFIVTCTTETKCHTPYICV